MSEVPLYRVFAHDGVISARNALDQDAQQRLQLLEGQFSWCARAWGLGRFIW